METDPQRKALLRARRDLLSLSNSVLLFLDQLDTAMMTAESNERGKRVGNLATWLDVRNDTARRYGLGLAITGEGKERALAKLKKGGRR